MKTTRRFMPHGSETLISDAQRLCALVSLCMVVLLAGCVSGEARPSVNASLATMSEPVDELGRFQLSQGRQVTFAGLEKEIERPILVKLDTVTGKTWVWVSFMDDQKKLNEFWSEMGDRPLDD